MKKFVVFRNGSNDANQPATERLLVWSGEAKDQEDAKLRARRGGVKCLDNQSLDAMPVDQLEAKDHAAYIEAQDTIRLQPLSLPTKLHTRMKMAAASKGKSLKDWRIEAYQEKLERG